MYRRLKYMRRHPNKHDTVYIASSNDGRIHGWSLIGKDEWVMVYVRVSSRGQGIGTKLIKMLVSHQSKIRTNPNFQASLVYSTVFKKNGITQSAEW